MTTPIVTRRAGLSDLDGLLGNLAAGIASYVEFAPVGWRAPDVNAWRDREAGLLSDPATWAQLALFDGLPVGHVSFLPGRERSAGESRGAWDARPIIPGLASLRQLFVRPEWWGRGVAPLLHDQAIAEMRAQGFQTVRLFTPGPHVRARRFYERRGWSTVAEEWNEELGLPLTEYRRILDA